MITSQIGQGHKSGDFSADRYFDNQFLRLAFVLFSVYVIITIIASFFPETFLWGINHLAFLELSTRITLLALALIVAIPFFSRRVYDFVGKMLDRVHSPKLLGVLFVVLTGIGGAWLFYHFRIVTDMYGDSRTLLTMLSGRHYGLADILRFNDNEPLSRLIHQSISEIFQLDLKTTFQIVSSICGGIFLVIVLFFAIKLSCPTTVKIFAVVLLVTCGTNQIFFGHVEDYTIVYLAIVLFQILAWKYFDGKRTLGLTTIILLLGVRLHMEMILLLPAYLYLLAHTMKEKYPALKAWIEPRNILILAGLSVVCATIAYFLFFKAYILSTDLESERSSKIFLPLLNPLPSPHGYSLLSINHLSDVAQEFLLTVSPGALIILCLGSVYFRRIRWKKPRIIFFALAAFYFFLFDLTVNPLLTAPRDWDFLSLAAAAVTFLAIAVGIELFQTIKSESIIKSFLGIVTGAAILSCSIFYINSDEIKAGHRLRSIGVWAYQSYYWGSSYMINVGANTMTNIDDEILERKRILGNLLPYQSENDIELSFLQQKIGHAYCVKKDYQSAREYLANAVLMCNGNLEALKLLTVVCLKTWQFDMASDFIDKYNEVVNDPEVTVPGGLTIAEYTHFLTFLVSNTKDSSVIERQLDEIPIGPR